MTLKVLWIDLLILPLTFILCVYGCLSPWGVFWTLRLPRARVCAWFWERWGRCEPSAWKPGRTLLDAVSPGSICFPTSWEPDGTAERSGYQRPSVAVALAGGFITNLRVLISLVMWRLPKKETRKSCVTEGETWRSTARRRAWQSSFQAAAATGSGRLCPLARMPTARPAGRSADAAEGAAVRAAAGRGEASGLGAALGLPIWPRELGGGREAALRWWQPGGAEGARCGAPSSPLGVLAPATPGNTPPSDASEAGTRGRLQSKPWRPGLGLADARALLSLMVNANSVLALQNPGMHLEQNIQGRFEFTGALLACFCFIASFFFPPQITK